VQEVIRTYAEQKLVTGARQLHTTLTSIPASLKDATCVVITVENDAQKENFQVYKQELLDYLRKELKNTTVTLDLIETQNITQKKAHTPLEKFENLKNKNPLLLEFKSRFGLEIDY
jgi:DNA polymerase III subunit gamma/tau